MEKFKLCAFADEADKMISGQIAALQGNSMNLIELRGIDGKNVADLTATEARDLKKRLDGEGIAVWSIGSPIGKVDITSPAADELDRFKRVLETANICGAENIRMFSFYGTNGEEQYRDLVMERLAKYVETTKGTDITLCHENEKGIYGDIAARCLEIHQNVPELKCVFDPANYVQVGQDTLEAWAMLEPYVFYGHIKDSLADGSIVPPGKGIGHIAEYLPKFAAKGCQVLTLEPHLKVFSALKDLETPGDESKVGLYHFETKRDAFDCAVNSLKEIIKEI